MPKAANRAQEAAELLAIQALNFLATAPERLSRLLALSGVDPASIRTAATGSGSPAGVLAHLGEDERLLTEFATAAAVTPAEVDRARRLLAGGGWEHEVPRSPARQRRPSRSLDSGRIFRREPGTHFAGKRSAGESVTWQASAATASMMFRSAPRAA